MMINTLLWDHSFHQKHIKKSTKFIMQADIFDYIQFCVCVPTAYSKPSENYSNYVQWYEIRALLMFTWRESKRDK